MHDVKNFFEVWVHDTLYSDEFRTQIEEHVRSMQAKTNQKVVQIVNFFNTFRFVDSLVFLTL